MLCVQNCVFARTSAAQQCVVWKFRRPDNQKKSCLLMSMSQLNYCPFKCVMQHDRSYCWEAWLLVLKAGTQVVKRVPENRESRWGWKSVDLWLACHSLVTHSTTLLFSIFLFYRWTFFVMLPERHSTFWGINQSMVLLVSLSNGMKSLSKHLLAWGPAKNSSLLPEGWHAVGWRAQSKLFSSFQDSQLLLYKAFVCIYLDPF